MTKLQKYQPTGDWPQWYQRNPFPFVDLFFDRGFEPLHFWGDIDRTGDTVRFKDGEELTVEIDLPGVSKDKTQITIDGRVVSVVGSRKVIHKGGTQEETFNRSFNVGNQFDINNAKAEQKDGVLSIMFPREKKSDTPKKTIEIS